jgi:hypothetical protein
MTNSDTTYGVHNKQTKEIKIHAKLDDSVVCTVTTTSPHGLSVDDKVTLSSVTLPGGTGLSEVDFEGLNFIVGTVPTDVTFTIASNGQASSIVSTGGSMTVEDKYWTATAVTPHLF